MKSPWRPFGPGKRIASAQAYFDYWAERMGPEIDRLAPFDYLVRNGPPDAENRGRALAAVERRDTAGATVVREGSDTLLEPEWRGLGADAATLLDHLAQGGWIIEQLPASTEHPRGRPRQALAHPATVALRIENQAPEFSLPEMLTTLRKHHRRGIERTQYEELARTVAGALSAPMGQPPAVTVASMAEFLSCSLNTVYRLRTKGKEMQKKSPKGGEAELRPSTYWGFADWTPVRDPENPFLTLYAPVRPASVVEPLEPTSLNYELEEAA